MRNTSFAHRLSTLAVTVATLLATLLAGPALWPGARLASARGLDGPQRSARVTSPVNPGAAPTSAPAPGTPAEAARFAERERQDGALAGFEGGARISTTTVIIILLLVIVLLLLL